MKVLALKSKHSTEYWNASDETAAFLAAFRFNNKLGCYGDLDAESVKEAEQEYADLLALKADLDAGKVQKLLLREAHMQTGPVTTATRYIENLKREVDLYKKAKKGNGAAAKLLFQYRKSNEYEWWEIVNVQKPSVPRKKR